MEFPGASGTPWAPKLSLENYLLLDKLDVVSSSILRKIIQMHGFKSIQVPKDDLMGAVKSLDLMDAHHSTLQSDVSSNAILSMNDVIKDLSVLHWQECCITSVETINCVTKFSSAVDEASSKCSKSECNTASSSRNDSAGHKTQSQAFNTRKRSAEPSKLNLDKMDTPVFSSKVDSQGHKTQSPTLNEIAASAKTSAKPVKPNSNAVYSSKAKLQASTKTLIVKKPVPITNCVIGLANAKTWDAIIENRLASNFNMPFCSKEDSGGHTTQFQPLEKIDGNTSSARFGKQVYQRRGIKKPRRGI